MSQGNLMAVQQQALEYQSIENGASDVVWPKIQRLLLSQPCSILEIGCGCGLISSRLAALGHKVIGTDLSESGIRQAKIAYSDIRFAVHSAYDDFHIIISPVDVVLAVEVIEHLTSPRKFLENAFQILKPDGSLILTTPYHGWLKNLALSIFNKWDSHFGVEWDGGHIKFFSEKSLSTMLRSVGFNEISFHNAGRLPYLWKSMVCKAIKTT